MVDLRFRKRKRKDRRVAVIFVEVNRRKKFSRRLIKMSRVEENMLYKAMKLAEEEEINKLPVQICPLNSWYKFKRCGVQTCKNYSTVTDSYCLEVDRKKPTGSKFITDAELHLFKYKNANMTTRMVSIRRKYAIDRSKWIVVLYKFIEYIMDKYEKQGEDSPFLSGHLVQQAQKRYPLHIKKLHFKNWMWHYITDEDVYEEFLDEFKGGECKLVKIENLLSLSTLNYEKLLKEIKEKK